MKMNDDLRPVRMTDTFLRSHDPESVERENPSEDKPASPSDGGAETAHSNEGMAIPPDSISRTDCRSPIKEERHSAGYA